ncbi:MAG: AraC family transcriptional regulator [Bacteroidales bacterium]|nr:AraC family transcriptional regulator [Bacteroidales bacterium]
MILQGFFIVMPMFISLFWAILLLLDKKTNIPKRYLAFFFFLSTISYFVCALFFYGERKLFVFWDNIYLFTSLAAYPLFYNYIRVVTKDESLPLKRILLLVPALCMAIFSFWLYFSMTPQEMSIYFEKIVCRQPEKNGIFSPLLQLQQLKLHLFKVVFTLQVMVTLYCSHKQIKQYNNRIKKSCSSSCNKQLSPINQLFYLFLAGSIISLITYFVGGEYLFERSWSIALTALLHSIFLFAIGFIGFYQNDIIVEFNRDLQATDITDTEKSAEGFEIKSTKQRYLQQLDQLMQEEQLFKNPDIKITDIVVMLGSNRTYVSQLINEEKGVNFREWINRYRVEYVKELMMDPEQSHLSIIAIAEMAGFSSKSTFYRVFKNQCGILPEAFRKRDIE